MTSYAAMQLNTLLEFFKQQSDDTMSINDKIRLLYNAILDVSGDFSKSLHDVIRYSDIYDLRESLTIIAKESTKLYPKTTRESTMIDELVRYFD
jgi:hypothetical protein